MSDLTTSAIDYARILARNQEEMRATQWVKFAEVMATIPARRIVTLGREPWRYMFYHHDQPVCVPIYENPMTGEYIGVLPEPPEAGSGDWVVKYFAGPMERTHGL